MSNFPNFLLNSNQPAIAPGTVTDIGWLRGIDSKFFNSSGFTPLPAYPAASK